MSATGLAGVLLCWPASGKPLAFFESDGVGFFISDLAETDDEIERTEVAVAAVIEWASQRVGDLPEGWRIALAGELLQ